MKMKSDEPFDFEAAYVEEREKDALVIRNENVGFENDVYRTVSRLPEEIKEFVSEHCRIYSVGVQDYGITWPGKSATRTVQKFKSDDENHLPMMNRIFQIFLKYFTPVADDQVETSENHQTTDDAWIIVVTEDFKEEAFAEFPGSLDDNIQGIQCFSNKT